MRWEKENRIRSLEKYSTIHAKLHQAFQNFDGILILSLSWHIHIKGISRKPSKNKTVFWKNVTGNCQRSVKLWQPTGEACDDKHLHSILTIWGEFGETQIRILSTMLWMGETWRTSIQYAYDPMRPKDAMCSLQLSTDSALCPLPGSDSYSKPRL